MALSDGPSNDVSHVATPPRRPPDLPSSYLLTPTPPQPRLSPSTTSLAAQGPQMITVDSLLANHASASSPERAALDTAVAERNSLSAQNMQLWKLVEKSRGAYQDAIKNLDRVRTERDAYKAKLQQIGENTDVVVRSFRERERSIKQSSDSNARSGSLDSRPREPKPSTVRHQSDDSNSINLTPEWGASRERDRPSKAPPHHSRSDSGPSAAQVANSSPVITAPPRSGSLPVPPATTVAPLQVPATRLQIPKFDNTQTPSLSTISASPVGTSPLSAISVSNSSQLYTSETSSPVDQPANVNNRLDASTALPRPVPLSRESRIDLPDEAKQYIVAMAESPLQSPRVPDIVRSNTNSPATPSKSSSALALSSTPEHLAAQNTASVAHTVSPADPPLAANASNTQSSTSEGEFHDLDDESSTYDSAADRSIVSSSPGDADGRSTALPNTDLTTTAFNETLDAPRSRPSLQNGEDSVPSVPASDSTSQRLDPPQRALAAPNTIPAPLIDTPTTPTANAYAAPAAGASFRALPLLAHDLPRTRISVTQSSIRPNDRGKDVLSFVVSVDAGNGKEPWVIEKMYSDVVGLDQRIRNRYGRAISKKVPHLPDGKLWRDHAPSRVDQRKAVLEQYLQTLLLLPVKNNDEVIAFLTSDIVRTTNKPVARLGYKEGYLTKRGKNFGGWKTRFFVLQGPVLEYYESRGGTHLGSIPITGAQIGRQQKPVDRRETEEESEYRHAFLIIEARKTSSASASRHVLCAESDSERDSWVDMLVRYVSGVFNDDASAGVSSGSLPINASVASLSTGQPRSSTSSTSESPVQTRSRPTRTMSKDEISVERAVPISQLPPDPKNAKLFASNVSLDDVAATETSSYTAQRLLNKGQSSSNAQDPPLSSSLPSPSTLSAADGEVETLAAVGPRANSELGHYADLRRPPVAEPSKQQQQQQRQGHRTSYHPNLSAVQASPEPHHAHPPDQQTVPQGKVKISMPMNGTPIPAGYKFGASEQAIPAPAAGKPEVKERREKAKSRLLWGWNKDRNTSGPTVNNSPPRAVFGVALEEALDVAQIANLPAVVFRCIQYLEAKKAHEEEGIYRLSGSSVVIKNLKDRFNAEADVDLLSNDEHWDLHAIAGVLKTFFRELPATILTGALHMRFMRVMDLVNADERIIELTRLVRLLPLANYSLLRALSGHLIMIVDNQQVNKMTMRNVGIVFSPTLGIPAGVFSLMLGSFSRVFDIEDPTAVAAPNVESDRRNSKQYSDAAADRLLGLAGRKLSAGMPGQGSPDDDDESLLHEDSGTEDTDTDADGVVAESSSGGTPSPQAGDGVTTSRAGAVAAGRGLVIDTSGESKRQSRMVGLPASPRPQGGGSPFNDNFNRGPGHEHQQYNGMTLQVPQ